MIGNHLKIEDFCLWIDFLKFTELFEDFNEGVLF